MNTKPKIKEKLGAARVTDMSAFNTIIDENTEKKANPVVPEEKVS